jgi:hypothetical protein
LITTEAVNGFTAGIITTQTELLTVALANVAGEISSTIRGAQYVKGAMADQESQAANTRQIQSETVRASGAFQYSTDLCGAATGQGVGIVAAVSNIAPKVLRSQAVAAASAGTLAGGAAAVLLQPVTRFKERQTLFASAADPASGGVNGPRPNGDRMPGAILAVKTLTQPLDKEMAAWVVANLVGPIDVAPLIAAQVGTPQGKRIYMERGHLETGLNLSRDFITDVMITDRADTIDPNWYNTIAAEGGLPLATGNVSLAQLRQMRDSDRFTPAYYARLAQLHAEPLLRELISLEISQLQQGAEANERLTGSLLIEASSLADGAGEKLRALMAEAGGH